LKCPSNVAKLTNLSTYELVDGLLHFEGRGLIIKNCPKFRSTQEFKALLSEKEDI
jgi:hypothetical protein